MLVIITGKTASGKDTLISKILEKYPNFKKVITATSRAPRGSEIESKDYYFLTRGEFEQKIKNNEFIEHVEYGGNLYGTFKNELESNLNLDLIWKIDPSRSGQIREYIRTSFPPGVASQLIEKIKVIYITCDDQTILQRLKERGVTPEEIERRSQDDTNLWQQYKTNYDFVIENVPGNLQIAIDKVCEIISSSK